MARPKKTGLDYFSVDTDRFQDIRIKRLKKDFGCNGFAVYEYLLNEIYRVRGCFIVWDESTAFDVAEYWGLKETTIKEIVTYCGSVGLFDKELLSCGIITSKSIQGRYLYMCEKSKRKELIIPEEIRLIPEESQLIPEETQLTPPIIPQNKVKESKENKKEKEKRKVSTSSSLASYDEILDWFTADFQIAFSQIRVNHEEFIRYGRKVLAEWQLKGWEPSRLQAGNGEFSAHKFSRWLIQQKQIEENENKRNNRFQQRRGIETSAKSGEDYSETL